MTISREDAHNCAADFIRRGRVCAGCKAYAVCGIGDRDAQSLANLLKKIDPDGLNIAVIPLPSLAQQD